MTILEYGNTFVLYVDIKVSDFELICSLLLCSMKD